ncbi:MAG: DUF2851 family protein [Flavobacteriales bacterium]
MKEAFLHTVWNHQLYNTKSLTSVDGEQIIVRFKGFHNHNSGPDFLEATIEVDSTVWYGQVEIHVKSSDWRAHGHQNDSNYLNVILHVVWENDLDIPELNCPVLELKGLVPNLYYQNYLKIEKQSEHLPCRFILNDLDAHWLSFYKEKMILERFEAKVQQVENETSEIKYQGIYEQFFYALGLNKNQEQFKKLSQYIPYKLLSKYANQPSRTTALLLGSAGFLNDVDESDGYIKQLISEYRHLKTLHQLEELPAHQWVFMRIRPSAFPTIKLALFAQLFSEIDTLENFLLHRSFSDIEHQLKNLELHPFWDTHYTLKKSSKPRKKGFGKQGLNTLWINAILPLKLTYAEAKEAELETSLEFLRNQKAEDNNITRLMEENGFKNQHALDSQFIIHKNKNYCISKKCLSCGIGLKILQKHD